MGDRPRLRVTEIRLVHLKTIEQVGALEPAWDPGRNWAFQRGGGSVVEVHTDQGLVGIGPGVDASLLPALRARLVGQDPFETEQHLAALRYYTRRGSLTGAARGWTSPCGTSSGKRAGSRSISCGAAAGTG